MPSADSQGSNVTEEEASDEKNVKSCVYLPRSMTKTLTLTCVPGSVPEFYCHRKPRAEHLSTMLHIISVHFAIQKAELELKHNGAHLARPNDGFQSSMEDVPRLLLYRGTELLQRNRKMLWGV